VLRVSQSRECASNLEETVRNIFSSCIEWVH
jgi:hypothetical protein